MSKPKPKPDPPNHNGQPQTAAPDPEPPSSAIQQAVALRDLLREAANQAAELIRTLQQDKKQSRQLHAALASIRQLQTLEV